jgi:hypothetical protein
VPRRRTPANAHPAPRSGSAASPGLAGAQIEFVAAARAAHRAKINVVAAGEAGFDADGLELPLHVGFQTDGQGMALHAPRCARELGRGGEGAPRPSSVSWIKKSLKSARSNWRGQGISRSRASKQLKINNLLPGAALMENGDSLFIKAIPGIVVAVFTQIALIARGYLDEQKKRRFLRAELKAEARDCLSILELFLKSIDDDIPEANSDLGVGLAIYIAPIRCREEYERLTSTTKNALPALSDQEFRTASELKRHFRLLVGYAEACDIYFQKLQEAGLSPGVTDESLANRREIFRRFGIEAKHNISKSAQKIKEYAFLLIESLEAKGFGILTPWL